MPSIKPAPGMTYDFEVEDVFYFKDGSVIITGTPSIEFSKLYPAVAEVRVNDGVVAHITITGELQSRPLDSRKQQVRSLVTMDKADLKARLSLGIHIHGVIVEKVNT